MPYGIRPTANLTRKAIFDIVGHDLSGQEAIDLFAGSGAVGLEALSRGAARVVFVESSPKCFEVIQANIRLLFPQSLPGSGDTVALCPRNTRDAAGRAELLNSDAFAAVKSLARQGRKFDLVFLDPPYGADLVKKILKTLSAYDIFKPNSFLIIEHGKHENLPEKEGRFSLLTHRKYGISFLGVYQVEDASAGTAQPLEEGPENSREGE